MEIRLPFGSDDIQDLKDRILDVLKKAEGEIRLNMIGINIIDSLELGCLALFARKLEQQRARLILTNVNSKLGVFLRLVKLDALLTIES